MYPATLYMSSSLPMSLTFWSSVFFWDVRHTGHNVLTHQTSISNNLDPISIDGIWPIWMNSLAIRALVCLHINNWSRGFQWNDLTRRALIISGLHHVICRRALQGYTVVGRCSNVQQTHQMAPSGGRASHRTACNRYDRTMLAGFVWSVQRKQ